MALILSIHEEKDSLALTERLLTAEGHQVISFEKVQEAVKWLAGHQPALVLVSGGRHGEKARKNVDQLKQAGLPGAKIVLLIGKGSLIPVPQALEKEVHQVLPEASENEDLLNWINAGLGVLSLSPQSIIQNGNLLLNKKEGM
jgi:DNA-binding NtrC family response regulator